MNTSCNFLRGNDGRSWTSRNRCSKMGTSTRCGCSWISRPIPMHLWKRGKQQSTIYYGRTYSAGITKCDPLRHHRMPKTKETIPIASFWFRTQCHVEKSNAECNIIKVLHHFAQLCQAQFSCKCSLLRSYTA